MTTAYGPCEVCWTISWAPIEEEAKCALQHPHAGEHIVCEYCELLAAHEKLLEETAKGG